MVRKGRGVANLVFVVCEAQPHPGRQNGRQRGYQLRKSVTAQLALLPRSARRQALIKDDPIQPIPRIQRIGDKMSTEDS